MITAARCLLELVAWIAFAAALFAPVAGIMLYTAATGLKP